MFSQENKLEPEYADAFNAWKVDPTPATRTQMLTTVNPVIDTAIRSYGNASPTLRSRAKQMTLTALDTYDPSKGRLKTHLISQLQGLRRHAAREQNIISIPEQVGLDQAWLRTAETELADDLGRDPSDAEIADKTGISRKRMTYIRQFRGAVAESGAMNQSPDGEDFSEPASRGLGKDDEGEAWLDFVYTDLGPTDRVIMDYTLGRNGSPRLALQEIARRLGITPSAASQRAAKIQRMIDERLTASII